MLPRAQIRVIFQVFAGGAILLAKIPAQAGLIIDDFTDPAEIRLPEGPNSVVTEGVGDLNATRTVGFRGIWLDPGQLAHADIGVSVPREYLVDVDDARRRMYVDAEYYNHEYNYFTKEFLIESRESLPPGQYMVKIVIHDVGADGGLSNLYVDSALFIEAGSFRVNSAPLPMGDYNGNGLVEQGDLDLVLLKWGQAVPPIPAGRQMVRRPPARFAPHLGGAGPRLRKAGRPGVGGEHARVTHLTTAADSGILGMEPPRRSRCRCPTHRNL